MVGGRVRFEACNRALEAGRVRESRRWGQAEATK